MAGKTLGALRVAVAMLFRGDPRLKTIIEIVLTLLGQSIDQLEDWIYSATFEGARYVFAGMKAHHLDINFWPLVHSSPRGRNLRQFFAKVAKKVKCTSRVCAL